MKTKITFFIAMLLFISMLRGQTTIPGGDVYGNWDPAGSPYLVEGDITVPADCTLIISAGVTVEFQDHYTFYVYGILDAPGTESDSIRFCAAKLIGYNGIKIYSDTLLTDSMRFLYCRFQDGNGIGTWPENCGSAIAILDYDLIRIQHCLMIDNEVYMGTNAAGGAIAMSNFNGIISHNTFIDNRSFYGGALMVWNMSNPHIHHNVFYNNRATYEAGAIMVWGDCHPVIEFNEFRANRAFQYGGAISTYEDSSPLIRKNLFDSNFALLRGGAIECFDIGKADLINNTFVNNASNKYGGAISIVNNSCPFVLNNIFWENYAGTGGQNIYNQDSLCIPDFFNNDVQYGKDSIGGFMPQGQWKANIDAYPEFEDTTSGNFHLTMISPCIDAGTDTILDPDGTISDIGAYFFDQTTGIAEAVDPADRPQLYCRPNPVSEEVAIVCCDPGAGCRDGRLSVYDMTGNKVDELPVNGITFIYNAAHLPPGMYLLRLQAGNEVSTGKMVKR